MTEPQSLAASSDDDLIDEARKRLQLCITVDDGDRDLSLEDLKFKKGEQWDEQSVRQRELDGRPCLTINNLPAIIHQVTNDVRQNRQAIKVHPVDDGADIETAEVIEGIIRHIEYDSGADAAYDTALDGAASIGFGFFRLVTEYCNPLSFDQDMKIKRIRNPFTVYIDPSAQEADASDMRFAFVSAKISKDEFKRTYPKAEATIDYIARGIGDDSNWLGEDYVRVTEYYRVEETSETLVRLSDGTARLATDRSALPPGIFPTKDTRQTTTRKIMWYKVTAKEVLERQEIPFDWIPIFVVYGDEIDINGAVTRSGLIRNAKDPAKMYNYWLTSATEEIALRTKTPYIGALGQFEGLEDDWAAANVRNFPYLEYNPVTVDGVAAPPPVRQPPADVPTGFIAMAGIARDNVKAVTGIFDASLGNRSNEVSGLAIRARQHQGDVGNFHYSDNLQRAIRHLGRTMISGIPRVYDTQRVMRILGEDGTAAHAPVNTPIAANDQKPDPKTGAIKTVLNDLTVGTYDVVVSTGPAYNTKREEALDGMLEAGKAYPQLWQIAGDKMVRAMDWPGAEDIADRMEKMLPPGIANDDDQADMVQTPKGPIPAQQAGQLIGQMDQAMEQMQQEMEKLQSGIALAQENNASRERIAEMNNTAKLDQTELSGMVDMILAGLQPMLAHAAAVVAAADPAHPDAPALIAQGLEQPPAQVEASEQAHQQALEQQPEPDAGKASAPAGE